VLDVKQIMELIPHRHPFLLVDRIVELEEGKRIVGIKNTTINDAFFQGHFPGYPLLPGAAQLSEIVLPCVRRALPALGRLKRMLRLKFQERILPGDELAVVLSVAADPSQIDFSLQRAGLVCAAGRLTFELAAVEEVRA